MSEPFEDTEQEAGRVSRRAKGIVWAMAMTMIVVALAVVVIVSHSGEAQRAGVAAQKAIQDERFRNTLQACEEQNTRNLAAKRQLTTFLASITPERPMTKAQRERSAKVLKGFVDALADSFVPARVDAEGRSTCLVYTQSRVRPIK